MLGTAAAVSRDGATHKPATTETPKPASDEALQVNGLSVIDAEGTLRLNNFTLIVNRGEIVGVAGVEGNGQSELAAALSGMTSTSDGRFFVRGRDMSGATPKALSAAGVGVVPEDRHAVGCITGMSLAENLSLNRLDRFKRFGLLDRAALRRAAAELMERFDVRAAGPDVAFGSLSGGNQQKAVLGREISTEGLVFLLAAQPTRGLDVGAVEAVYGQIRAACRRGVGVLLISSELDELIDVADRIVVLYRGRVMGHCPAEPAQRERIGTMMAGQQA
jgi:simple sugar transport system ATP-binding protein